jgi:hypothetical protein
MKSILVLLLLGFLLGNVSAQKQKVEIYHYVFPEFMKGTVLMKSGKKNEAMLNYNALTDEMIFDQNGKKLAMTHLPDIDTVYIDGRRFFPLENKLVELLYQNKYELYVLYRANIVDPGKPAAYGGTSQTSSTTSYSSIISGGQAYELALPEGTETKASLDYWLKKDGKVTMFLNLRQLAKQFEQKSTEFKKYVKENKVKYEDQESLLGLVKYMEGL